MLAVVAGIALALPALAAANCVTNSDPSRHADSNHYAEGYLHNDSTPYTIIKANLVVRNPDLAPNCSTYLCFSWAWIMMVTNGAPGGWAQIGPDHGNLKGFGTVAAGTDADQCAMYNSNGVVTDLYTNWFQTSSVGSDPLYAVQKGDGSQRSCK